MIQPITPTTVIRLCVVVIVLLSLIAGYYYTSYGSLQKKYLLLEQKYVTVNKGS